MSGFGFSVGDFFAAAEIIIKIVKCLRTTGGARTAYLELCLDLDGLTSTLRKVDSLQQGGHVDDIASLRHACIVCINKIVEFTEKIQRSKAMLRESSQVAYGWREIWAKIDWTLFQESEVKEFKAALTNSLQRVQMEQLNLILTRVNMFMGIQAAHGQSIDRILGVVQCVYSNLHLPPSYEELHAEDPTMKRDLFQSALSANLLTEKGIDNVLKELRKIGRQYDAHPGASAVQTRIVTVIQETNLAFKSLQKKAFFLNRIQLAQVLHNLSTILEKYDESAFIRLSLDTKKRVVDAMGKSLECSLDFTDHTIAVLCEHQRGLDPESGHIVDSSQDSQYYRVSLCITSLVQVAAQFDSYVITSTSKNNYKTYVQYIEDVRQPNSYHDKSPQSVVQIVPSSGANSQDSSELLYACRERKIALVRQLLGRPGIDISAVDNCRRGVLHLAIGNGKVDCNPAKRSSIMEIVRLLVRSGADINATDSMGLRPIHLCAQTINFPATQYLVENGVDINAFDLRERTALNFTTMDSQPDANFVEMLLRYGARLGSAKLPKLPPRANMSQKKVRMLINNKEIGR